jgi:hypothetical protein
MTTQRVFAERFASQGLSGEPARDPAAVAERLLAVQGQDPRRARIEPGCKSLTTLNIFAQGVEQFVSPP